jgi:hypothetical protein
MLQLFQEIPARGALRFSITRPATISLPAIGKKSHQQGIQRTTDGQFVVSGSGSQSGYIYFAAASSLKIIGVLSPVVRDFSHIGGIQVAEDILATGYERLESGASGASVVLFYDVRDAASPAALDHLTIDRNSANNTAGAIGLCRDGDTWLLLVANWDSERLDFYRSNGDDLFAGGTRFALVGSWEFSVNGFGAGSIDDGWEAYQNINLLADRDGSLWFVGMHTDWLKANNSIDVLKTDRADLYQLSIGSSEITVTKRANKRFYRNGEGPRFRYGSGFRLNGVTSRFEVYSCEANLSNGGTVNRCNRWG